MQVICLEEAAFYMLVEQVVARLKEKSGQDKEQWVSDEEAMKLLNIKSKTTLQKLRDEGKIRFSQPQKKIIVYDRQSIAQYLEKMPVIQSDMEETETPHPDYLKGFNEGYIIAEHMPELARNLDKALTESQRSQGFQHGVKQYNQEKVKSRYPSYLRSDRLSSLNKSNELFKDQDKDSPERE